MNERVQTTRSPTPVSTETTDGRSYSCTNQLLKSWESKVRQPQCLILVEKYTLKKARKSCLWAVPPVLGPVQCMEHHGLINTWHLLLSPQPRGTLPTGKSMSRWPLASPLAQWTPVMVQKYCSFFFSSLCWGMSPPTQ